MIEIPGYTILQKISEGEYSFVYTALHDQSQRKVIIKALKDQYPSHELIARFKQEYYLLELAGTTTVLGMEVHNNIYGIIMEDDGSKSLKSLIKEKSLTLDKFFEIVLNIIKSLEMIHSHHIVHKDINPTNILWNDTSKQARIIDFGLSSILASEETEFSQFQEHGGMLAYISPEQTGRLNRPIDYRTDFYSLGITLYELLAGIPPFRQEDILELIHAHLTLTPEAISKLNPDVPPMVAAIINKLMAKMPEDRYASIAGLKADILECMQQWLKTGKIESFVLGQVDRQDHLILSQKLYGREDQVMHMLNIFERVSKGANEILLIGGYSGIGKTSLVKEIYKPITQQRGYFISGKFDQLNHGIPYSAFITAFNELILRFLAIPENELLQLKDKLTQVVGQYGELIAKVIPNINLIIGQPEPMPALPANEIQKKLISTLQGVIQTFSQPTHPLVIFLDDLQWADVSSLRLINTLLMDPDLKYFFLIGAYRDNEVGLDHPLMFLREEWDDAHAHYNVVQLMPLKIADVHHMLADSLAPTGNTSPLADLFFKKTRGNPFFINQFLKMLYNNKLLTFSYKRHQWEWDLAQIEEQNITENVVDLLISRIKRLPDESQELLKLASCIGHSFNLQTLATISERNIFEVNESLWELLNDSFILPASKNVRLTNQLLTLNNSAEVAEKIEFRFIHDRVQQAAYQSIDEEVKKVTHLKIGRLLLKDKKLEEKDKLLLEILPHLNQSSDLIQDREEKKMLAQYNLWGGKQVASAAAFQLAKEFFNKGIDLLKEFDLEEKYDLYFELYKELATCQFVTGEVAEAEINYKNLLRLANQKLSAIEVARLAAYMLVSLNKQKEALKIGLDALKLVDIRVSLNPSIFEVIRRFIKIRWLIGRRKITDINLPPLKSKEFNEITQLLEGLFAISLTSDPKLYVILNLINIEISLKYGFSENVLCSYVVCAGVILHRLGMPNKAFEWIQFSQKYNLDDCSTRIQGLYLLFKGLLIDPWYMPFKNIKESMMTSFLLNEKQNVGMAASALLYLCVLDFTIGKSLIDVKKTLEKANVYVKKLNIKMFIELTFSLNYLIECLQDNKFQISQLELMEQSVIQSKNNVVFNMFYNYTTALCYILGQYDEALKYGEKGLFYIDAIPGSPNNLFGTFYYGLTIGAVYDNASNKKLLSKHFNIVFNFLNKWAKVYPANYQGHIYLLLALKSKMNKNSVDAMKFFIKAIKEFELLNNVLLIAVANECASQFYYSMELTDVANVHLIHAYKAYLAYGATQKASQMKSKNTELLSLDTNTTFHRSKSITETALASIDVLSLMRATQVISEEMQLDILLQKLLILLLQNAGADCGTLITKDENEGWYVRAQGTVSAQDITLSRMKPVEQRTDVPLSLIRYVQRTGEPIVVQDEKSFSNYNKDPYFAKNQPQSVIALPIIYKNHLSGVLYLENNTIRHAFTPEHLHILKVLASQAAISIENAQLYYQATHDPLTGLANRNLLYQLFKISAQQADHKGTTIAILYYDLDGFKKVNDSLGHNIGDKLLFYVAEQIQLSVRGGDLAVRLGGDEFVAMLVDTSPEQVTKITARFLDKIKKPIHIDGHEVYIGCSIGASFYPINSRDIAELLKQADAALYRVKSGGKGACQFYTPNIEHQLVEDRLVENELRMALEQNQFEVFYQPIFTSKNYKVCRLEALLRWHHPRKGLLTAAEFIPIAELTGLILPISPWVLEQVVKQIRQWLDLKIEVPPVAINISGVQLKKQPLSEMIVSILEKYQVDPKYVALEFTESMFIDSDEKIVQDISSLKSLGIVLSLDDFGTFYSSLSYLRRFAVDHIKIDKSFIKDVMTNERDQKLVLSIITIARNLKLQVVAEGIENAKQLAFLEKNGVDELQGFYLSRPMNKTDCQQLLVEKQTQL